MGAGEVVRSFMQNTSGGIYKKWRANGQVVTGLE